MLILALTTDKISLISGSAATLDAHVSYMDYNGTTVTPGKQNTAISLATTTDILGVPGASTQRNAKTINVRNKSTTLSCDVTIQFNANGTLFELHKVTLNTGDCLQYIEGIGWFTITSAAKLDTKLRVTADVINATTSFADVTGLTCPVKSGKFYNFLAHLYHQTNATTTGAQFGVNGPSITSMIASAIQQITSSVTAAAYGSSASVTARDTAAVVETTGPGAVNMLAIMSGMINPSADGTFAVRCVSEVAVAAGLTVKAGSWCRIWETDN